MRVDFSEYPQRRHPAVDGMVITCRHIYMRCLHEYLSVIGATGDRGTYVERVGSDIN